MSKYLFYPGCAMETSARAYNESLMAIKDIIGLEIEEVHDWNCCGATEYVGLSLTPAYALIGRNLALAAKQANNGNKVLMASCSACYLNLAKADHYMAERQTLQTRVNEGLAAGGLHYQPGTLEVRHLMDVIINDIGLETIKSKVTRPLQGLRIAPYLGCMVPRPDYEGRWSDHEHPKELDWLLKALGAEVIDFPLKTHCCSGHMTQISPNTAFELIRRLISSADQYKADLMVTVCPMCQMNIDAYQRETNHHFGTNYTMPILFFTQIMGIAFGVEPKLLGFGREMVSAKAALARIGVEVPVPEAPAQPKRKKAGGLPMPAMPNSQEEVEIVTAEAETAEKKERIGVYVCHCGSNIAGIVDVEDVATWAGKELADRGVVVARDYKFMCSSLGQELIEKDIQEAGLTRVVVAACSPHLHENTFRTACGRGGLNPYLCELVSIREQVSWVHTDHQAATEKSKAILSGGVERVIHNEPLEPLRVPIHPATLVVGGGIAGIQAALEIADAGFPVYMVEREPSIGGHMSQFDKTFPTLDCAACILTPRMVSVGNHPHVKLFTYSEVERVDGFVGSFTVTIRKKARCVTEELCTGCGISQEKCPKKVIDDVYEAGLGYRKAVYTPFPQAVPKYPVIDKPNCTFFQKGTCKACQKFCPTNAIDFTQEDELITVQVGNIVLATGYQLFDPRRVTQYGYGRLANVFTSLEFERLTNAAGPTNGSIVLRDGVTTPKTVGIIHCVGSRDRNFNNYCSVICCMQSLKFAHLVHERTNATVYNFYIDMRTAYKEYDEFYQRVLEEGTLFVRGKVAEVTDAARKPGEEGKLIVQVEDTLVGKQRRIPVDMVILSAAMEPRDDSKEVAHKFGISCSASGWFTEKHPKLDPVATMTEGIYIAGCVQGPKDIPQSVSQGAAAAARVLGKIQQGEISLEPVRASVDESKCSGCRICNNMCPFNAIIYHAERMVTEVNPALCQGCGTCVAACPAGAISGTCFSNEQIFAQIEGLLRVNFAHERVAALV